MAAVDADLIYEILKRIQSDIAQLKDGQRDLRSEMITMRGHIVTMQQDVHHLYTRLDRMDQRLDRIENRLELRELAEAQARFEPHP